jgi:uncharacterized protein (TIGR00251 family)
LITVHFALMAQELLLSERDGWVFIPIRVQPRASRDAIAGVHGGALKIALRAPPVEGAANLALVTFLAKKLEIAQHRVRLVRGMNAKQKVIAVEGMSPASVHALIFRK